MWKVQIEGTIPRGLPVDKAWHPTGDQDVARIDVAVDDGQLPSVVDQSLDLLVVRSILKPSSVVSHDRAFLDTLEINRATAMKDGRSRWLGSAEEYAQVCV